MKRLFIALGVIGFFVLLGTAGASDTGSLERNQILVRSAVGLAMLLTGYLGVRFDELRKAGKNRKTYHQKAVQSGEYNHAHTHHAA